MESQIIDVHDFFEYCNAFFTDKEKFARISLTSKIGHSYALRRTIAKAFPLQSQQFFNYIGVDVLAMTEFFHRKLCRGKVPQWNYTKAQKGGKAINILNASDEEFVTLAKAISGDYKDVKRYCVQNPVEGKAALEEIKKYLQPLTK